MGFLAVNLVETNNAVLEVIPPAQHPCMYWRDAAGVRSHYVDGGSGSWRPIHSRMQSASELRSRLPVLAFKCPISLVYKNVSFLRETEGSDKSLRVNDNTI